MWDYLLSRECIKFGNGRLSVRESKKERLKSSIFPGQLENGSRGKSLHHICGTAVKLLIALVCFTMNIHFVLETQNVQESLLQIFRACCLMKLQVESALSIQHEALENHSRRGKKISKWNSRIDSPTQNRWRKNNLTVANRWRCLIICKSRDVSVWQIRTQILINC